MYTEATQNHSVLFRVLFPCSFRGFVKESPAGISPCGRLRLRPNPGIFSVMKDTVAKKVQVMHGEYLRLKKVDRQFGAFLSYAGHLLDIEKAREDASAGRLISQETLFRRLRI